MLRGLSSLDLIQLELLYLRSNGEAEEFRRDKERTDFGQ